MTATALANLAPRKSLAACTLAEMMQHPEATRLLGQVAARHVSPERMLRLLASAVRTTPKLDTCTPLSLIGALMTCASLGLEPNTVLGHAYLVPFEKNSKDKLSGQWSKTTEVQLIIGYRGFIDLARRSGELISIHADVVRERDVFEYHYGSNSRLRHVPALDASDQPWTAAYAHAQLRGGEAFEVWSRAKVLGIRDNSQGWRAYQNLLKDGKTPRTPPIWVQYEEEMAAKTMIRRLAKYLPLSVEFAAALSIDERPVNYIDVAANGVNVVENGAPLLADEPEDDPPSAPVSAPTPTAASAQSYTRARPDSWSTQSELRPKRSPADAKSDFESALEAASTLAEIEAVAEAFFDPALDDVDQARRRALIAHRRAELGGGA